MAQENLRLTQRLPIGKNNPSVKKTRLREVAIFWWIFTLAVILFGIFEVDRLFVSELITYIGIWLVVSLGCLYFIKKWTFSVALGKGVDILEIPVYLSFAGLVLISLFGIFPYLDRKYMIPALDISKDLPLGLLLIGIGYVAMWIGYALTVTVLKTPAIHRKILSKPGLNFNNPILIRAIGLYGFIIILKLYFYSNISTNQLNLGVLQQPLTFFLEGSWLLLALFTVQTALRRWPRWVFYVVIVLEIFTVVLSGWSSGLIKILFVLVASFAYTRKRISYPLLLVIVVLGFVLTPVARSMRSSDRSSLNKVTNTFITSTNTYWEDGREGTSFNQELLIRRQSGTAQLPGLILKLTPSHLPYRSTEELLSIPISFIPRVFWPEKFESGGKGIIFAEEYLGLVGHGSAAATMAGSAFMYGGWGFVIFMMGLAGVIFAFTYYLIMVPALNTQQVGLFALYAGILIANFHLGEGDISGMWQGLIQRTFVLFTLLIGLCIKKR